MASVEAPEPSDGCSPFVGPAPARERNFSRGLGPADAKLQRWLRVLGRHLVELRRVVPAADGQPDLPSQPTEKAETSLEVAAAAAAVAAASLAPSPPLAALPDGYTLYRHYVGAAFETESEYQRRASGQPQAPLRNMETIDGINYRTDLYLFGHPQGQPFRSVPEFLPHLVWLDAGSGGDYDRRDYSACRCELCPRYIAQMRRLYLQFTRPLHRAEGPTGSMRTVEEAPAAAFRVGETVWVPVTFDDSHRPMNGSALLDVDLTDPEYDLMVSLRSMLKKTPMEQSAQSGIQPAAAASAGTASGAMATTWANGRGSAASSAESGPVASEATAAREPTDLESKLLSGPLALYPRRGTAPGLSAAQIEVLRSRLTFFPARIASRQCYRPPAVAGAGGQGPAVKLPALAIVVYEAQVEGLDGFKVIVTHSTAFPYLEYPISSDNSGLPAELREKHQQALVGAAAEASVIEPLGRRTEMVEAADLRERLAEGLGVDIAAAAASSAPASGPIGVPHFAGLRFGAELLRVGDFVRLRASEERRGMQCMVISSIMDVSGVVSGGGEPQLVVGGRIFVRQNDFSVTMAEFKTKMNAWHPAFRTRGSYHHKFPAVVRVQELAGRFYAVRSPMILVHEAHGEAASYWHNWAAVDSNQPLSCMPAGSAGRVRAGSPAEGAAGETDHEAFVLWPNLVDDSDVVGDGGRRSDVRAAIAGAKRRALQLPPAVITASAAAAAAAAVTGTDAAGGMPSDGESADEQVIAQGGAPAVCRPASNAGSSASTGSTGSADGMDMMDVDAPAARRARAVSPGRDRGDRYGRDDARYERGDRNERDRNDRDRYERDRHERDRHERDRSDRDRHERDRHERDGRGDRDERGDRERERPRVPVASRLGRATAGPASPAPPHKRPADQLGAPAQDGSAPDAGPASKRLHAAPPAAPPPAAHGPAPGHAQKTSSLSTSLSSLSSSLSSLASSDQQFKVTASVRSSSVLSNLLDQAHPSVSAQAAPATGAASLPSHRASHGPSQSSSDAEPTPAAIAMLRIAEAAARIAVAAGLQVPVAGPQAPAAAPHDSKTPVDLPPPSFPDSVQILPATSRSQSSARQRASPAPAAVSHAQDSRLAQIMSHHQQQQQLDQRPPQPQSVQRQYPSAQQHKQQPPAQQQHSSAQHQYSSTQRLQPRHQHQHQHQQPARSAAPANRSATVAPRSALPSESISTPAPAEPQPSPTPLLSPAQSSVGAPPADATVAPQYGASPTPSSFTAPLSAGSSNSSQFTLIWSPPGSSVVKAASSVLTVLCSTDDKHIVRFTGSSAFARHFVTNSPIQVAKFISRDTQVDLVMKDKILNGQFFGPNADGSLVCLQLVKFGPRKGQTAPPELRELLALSKSHIGLFRSRQFVGFVWSTEVDVVLIVASSVEMLAGTFPFLVPHFA
ncbi:hypothetical protein HK105_200610 [Polyrhizophydium stewartii]|uniref:Cryptic loci regulator 2 N-terminal domain-containing protein n=1 Tax=Polyrhizophydium stewartii TaxID=2732419 RepID=A0ABR4NJR8_9FUNG